MPQGWKNISYTSQLQLLITFFLTIVITLPFVMEGFVDEPHRDAKDFYIRRTGRAQFLSRHLN